MVIAVDRSGSVKRAGTGDVIRQALTDFITGGRARGSTGFEESRDVLGLGSFGASWKAEYPPAANFRTGQNTLAGAIANMPFQDGVTNTSEALYQAYAWICQTRKPQNVNVILLITDGRPSAFTATFDLKSACNPNGRATGVIAARMDGTWPPDDRRARTVGLFKPQWTETGDLSLVDDMVGCRYPAGARLAVASSFYLEAPEFPVLDAHGNLTTAPFYPLERRRSSSAGDVRYAAFNAADNMATTIRSDSIFHPVLIVVALQQPTAVEEPLDPDWLARIANDPSYLTAKGERIFQAGQTAGIFRLVSPATLASGLASALSRLRSQTGQRDSER